MIERLRSLLPMPRDLFDPDTLIVHQDDETTIVFKKGGSGKLPEKPQQPKQGKDIQYIVVKQMNRPTRSGK